MLGEVRLGEAPWGEDAAVAASGEAVGVLPEGVIAGGVMFMGDAPSVEMAGACLPGHTRKIRMRVVTGHHHIGSSCGDCGVVTAVWGTWVENL
ncbi:hypothetical protein GCM10009563_20570 [Subtercola frigoramans]